MNKRDLFEQNIKNAVEDYEAPLDMASWDKIEQKLSVGTGNGIRGIKGWIVGFVVVAATATGYWYFTKPSTIEDINLNKKENIEQIDIKIEDDVIEESIIKNENQSTEPVNLNTDQSEIDLEQKESIEVINDSEDAESTDQTPVNENKEDELILDDPEQAINESVEADENLMVNWIISKSVLCQGEELMVSIHNVNEPVELVWDFGDGNSSTDPEVYHKYSDPGTYTIKLKANSLISDKKVYREKKYIEVKANPQSAFVIVENENMSAFPEVEFQNLTTYYDHLEWDFTNEKVENKNSVKRLYRDKGRFQIGLIVTNHFGCKDSIYKDLIIENDYNLLAPVSFSPNDDGLNETFLPEALTFLNKDFSMQIINTKSGRQVFETQNIESPWNGKQDNSGAVLKAGIYAWTVVFEDGSIYTGTVKLLSE